MAKDDDDFTCIECGEDCSGSPDLDMEHGRDEQIGHFLNSDEWCEAMVAHDGENLIIRFRAPDGTEEIFDAKIRRSIEYVLDSQKKEVN